MAIIPSKVLCSNVHTLQDPKSLMAEEGSSCFHGLFCPASSGLSFVISFMVSFVLFMIFQTVYEEGYSWLPAASGGGGGRGDGGRGDGDGSSPAGGGVCGGLDVST